MISAITGAFNLKLADILPSYVPARFIWDLTRNSGAKPMFAVRPGAGANVEGTNKSITVDQDFEVVLMRKWKPNAQVNDNDLDAQINQLLDDQEQVWREIFQRRLDLANVLVVSVVDIAAPEIDNDNNTASVAVTFTVKYRTSI